MSYAEQCAGYPPHRSTPCFERVWKVGLCRSCYDHRETVLGADEAGYYARGKSCKCGRRIQRTSTVCRQCNMSGVAQPKAKASIDKSPPPRVFPGLRGKDGEMGALLGEK